MQLCIYSRLQYLIGDKQYSVCTTSPAWRSNTLFPVVLMRDSTVIIWNWQCRCQHCYPKSLKRMLEKSNVEDDFLWINCVSSDKERPSITVKEESLEPHFIFIRVGCWYVTAGAWLDCHNTCANNIVVIRYRWSGCLKNRMSKTISCD